MSLITTDLIYLSEACRELMLTPSASQQLIGCVDNGELIAAGICEEYNQVSLHVHIWIKENKFPCREWYAAIFDYPFNQLKVHKIIGRVVESNVGASKLDEHFGFVLEATIKNGSPLGDYNYYTMTKEQCKILNSPLWAKTVNKLKVVGG